MTAAQGGTHRIASVSWCPDCGRVVTPAPFPTVARQHLFYLLPNLLPREVKDPFLLLCWIIYHLLALLMFQKQPEICFLYEGS